MEAKGTPDPSLERYPPDKASDHQVPYIKTIPFFSFIHPTIFEPLLQDTALGTKDPRSQDTSSPAL